MPVPLVHALALVKQAAALVNKDLGELEPRLADADRGAPLPTWSQGKYDDEFPLVVWQTGSGTQSNMNANEVIANLANERLGGKRGGKSPVHPNDHVNRGQSSNDTLPDRDAHRGRARDRRPAAAGAAPSPRARSTTKAEAFADIVKIGRTHLQDATPVTLGQEFSGYAAQVELGIAADRGDAARASTRSPRAAPPSAPASTRIRNSPSASPPRCAELTGLPFTSAANKFEALAVPRRARLHARARSRASRPACSRSPTTSA